MEEKIRRLVEWAKGKKALPYSIELNITNKCNLLCKMCWLRSTKPDNKELPDGKLLQTVNEAIEFGVEEFRFPGSGEPLMRKKILFELMKIVKENGRKGLLISNGTLFSEHDIKTLIEIDWDILTISLDGPSPEINDYIRGVSGAFCRTVKTLSFIKKWKKKLKRANPWLRMNVVLTNKNYDKLEEMIVLASKFGFNEVLLQPMTIFSKEGEKLKVSKRQELDKYLTKAVKRAKGLGVLTNMKDFIKNEVVERTSEMNKLILKKTKKSKSFLSVPCFEPWYNMIILPNGQVGPCAIFGGNGKASMVDKSLKEIWFGDYFHEIRERLLKRNLFPFCKNCCVPVFLENTRIRKELERLI